MQRERFKTMMKKLETKFPHQSKVGRRNAVLPRVSLVHWAEKAGVGRTQLLALLRSGTKRMSLTVARRLAAAFQWRDHGEVEEFVNMVAETYRKKKADRPAPSVVVDDSVNPPATTGLG